MLNRACLLALIGTSLATVAGCGGGKAPEPPASSIPGGESAASRRYMKPEYQQAFKDGKVTWKPGMKPPTPKPGAAPKP